MVNTESVLHSVRMFMATTIRSLLGILAILMFHATVLSTINYLLINSIRKKLVIDEGRCLFWFRVIVLLAIEFILSTQTQKTFGISAY